MAFVARLSSVEIDIFLTSASPGQRDIVRALREIITRRAAGLAERVSRDKPLTGYLVYEGPGDQLVFAIGLTVFVALPAAPAAYLLERSSTQPSAAAGVLPDASVRPSPADWVLVLRREERLEGHLGDRGIHARASVGDPHWPDRVLPP